MCRSVDLGCHIKEGFHQAVENGFSVAARLLGEAAKEGLHSLATFWIDVDSPTLATGSGDRWTNTETVSFLQEHVLTVSAAIFTLAILVAGVRIAWEQRARPLQQLLKATMIFILVSTAGTATLQLLASWSDEFALDLVQESLPQNQSFDTAVGEVILHGVMTNYAALGMPLSTALWISLAVFAASVIQVILLLIRSAMLVLLAGTFPLAAAATNTEIGKNWFRKYCGWALAFIAYKPAAALIYAAAFRMSQQSMGAQGDDTLVQVLTGVMMLLLAIVALPALLRFAVPITAAVAGGHVGTGSSSADPGNLASGAVNVARARLAAGPRRRRRFRRWYWRWSLRKRRVRRPSLRRNRSRSRRQPGRRRWCGNRRPKVLRLPRRRRLPLRRRTRRRHPHPLQLHRPQILRLRRPHPPPPPRPRTRRAPTTPRTPTPFRQRLAQGLPPARNPHAVNPPTPTEVRARAVRGLWVDRTPRRGGLRRRRCFPRSCRSRS